MEIINKIKEKYKLDVNRVVDEYDQYLRLALITTTPFQDIVNRKLSPRNRLFQRLLFLHYVYLIPRYAFLCLLYLKNEDTQKYYQQLLGDYGEEFGLLGRTFNICYVVFSIEIVINVIVMRRHEENASVEFLTDWLTRVPQTVDNQDRTVENKPASVDLDNDMKHQLISQLHYKMVFAKQISRSTNQSLLLYDLTACGLFFYRRKPSLVSTCLTLYNWVACVIGIQIAGNHFYSLYLSFVVTADYFKIRIKRIMTRTDSIQKKGITNRSLIEILNDYDQMLTVFNKYNKVLKHLLRNMVDFYAVGLTFAFFMCTIRTDPWMVVIMFMCAAGYAFTILVTGVYISKVHTLVFNLHNELCALSARHAIVKPSLVSLKNILRLRIVNKELGSLQTNGQFVIGMRDGEGPATSRLEIFNLTLTTISNTLMMIQFVYQD